MRKGRLQPTNPPRCGMAPMKPGAGLRSRGGFRELSHIMRICHWRWPWSGPNVTLASTFEPLYVAAGAWRQPLGRPDANYFGHPCTKGAGPASQTSGAGCGPPHQLGSALQSYLRGTLVTWRRAILEVPWR